jgi:hypothetical protein
MHVSSIVGDLEAHCASATTIARCALEQAAASDSGLMTKMAEVADGFQAIVTRLESLELGSAPAPTRPASLLQQFSTRSPPSSADGGLILLLLLS